MTGLRLGDLVEGITVGWVGPMADKYVASGVPFLRTLNVKPYTISTTDLMYISAEFHESLRKSRLLPGDVVVARTGRPGTATVIPQWLGEANCSDLVVIRPGDAVDSRFLVYYLNSRIGQHLIHARNVGSVQKHFNIKAARGLPFPDTPIDDQRRIAAVLGALDDKIELNQNMNQTLEEMAQAIFKSWFIDFDGHDPADLIDSELGPIPRGWEIGDVSAIARLDTRSIKPAENRDKSWEHYSIPAFDEGAVPSVDVGETIKSAKYIVDPSAILVSKLNPQFKRVWMPDVQDEDAAICSTEFMPFVPEHGQRAIAFDLFSSEVVQSEICKKVTGSTGSRQRVKPKEVACMPLPVPPLDLRGAYEAVADPLHKRRLLNIRESGVLEALRNTLLPKLISGELRVPEAEEQVEAAL